jgi:CMP-N,N'-diacetyllegionaminic acid synthase
VIKAATNWTDLMTKNVIAMVPVRAGSIRVPNKNTRPFGDTNLLQLKLSLLNQLSGITKIIVSTDCEMSAEIACKSGATIQWRDSYYAGSEITNDQHWFHIADTTPGDIVFLAQVTSPLLRVSSMQAALNSFLNLDKHDSINSVSSEKKFLWEGRKPLNYNAKVTPKSQDLPDIVSLNFALTIISRQTMMERKNVVGFKPNFVKLDKVEALDIDDLIDFKIAELLYLELGKEWLLH